MSGNKVAKCRAPSFPGDPAGTKILRGWSRRRDLQPRLTDFRAAGCPPVQLIGADLVEVFIYFTSSVRLRAAPKMPLN